MLDKLGMRKKNKFVIKIKKIQEANFAQKKISEFFLLELQLLTLKRYSYLHSLTITVSQ